MIEVKEEHHDELRFCSTGPIQNEMLTLTAEHPSSEDHFESKLQAEFSPSEIALKKEEELIESMIKTQEFKEEHYDGLRKFSSGPIQNEVLTITSEHPSYENRFEWKFKDNIFLSNQILEKPEEELIKLNGEQQMDPKKIIIITHWK